MISSKFIVLLQYTYCTRKSPLRCAVHVIISNLGHMKHYFIAERFYFVLSKRQHYNLHGSQFLFHSWVSRMRDKITVHSHPAKSSFCTKCTHPYSWGNQFYTPNDTHGHKVHSATNILHPPLYIFQRISGKTRLYIRLYSWILVI